MVGNTELEGVPESCHLRRSRAAWLDVESIDKDSEAQTKEVAVSFGRRVVEPAWLRSPPKVLFHLLIAMVPELPGLH